MVTGLAAFLRERKDKITTKTRVNVVRQKTGYSDETWWMTTVSFDEIESIDFDQLMKQIEEFEATFKGSKTNPQKAMENLQCQ